MRSRLRPLVYGLASLVVAWLAISMTRAGDKEHEHADHEHGQTTPPAGAHDESKAGHSHEHSSLHGGQVSMSKAHHFETVFLPTGIAVYTYSMKQAPLMAGKAKGTVRLKYKDGASKVISLAVKAPAAGEEAVYFCPMHEQVVQMEPGECELCQGMKLYKQDFLFGAIDLSKIAPGSFKAVVEISKLESKDEPKAVFTESFSGLTEKPHQAEAEEDHSDHHH